MQYGFVVLFAPAFPLVAAIALVVNAIEAAIDTHKVLYSYSRPMPQGGESIGAWTTVFEVYVAASAVTNLTVCVFTYSGPLFNNLVGSGTEQ